MNLPFVVPLFSGSEAANQPDETVLRRQVVELRAEGKSLMPDGLEQALPERDMADLLEFLRHPEAGLLPKDR